MKVSDLRLTDQSNTSKLFVCYRRCGEEGHKVAECDQEEKTRTIVGEVSLFVFL